MSCKRSQFPKVFSLQNLFYVIAVFLFGRYGNAKIDEIISRMGDAILTRVVAFLFEYEWRFWLLMLAILVFSLIVEEKGWLGFLPNWAIPAVIVIAIAVIIISASLLQPSKIIQPFSQVPVPSETSQNSLSNPVVNLPLTPTSDPADLFYFERWDDPYGVYSIEIPQGFFEIEPQVGMFLPPYPYDFVSDEFRMTISYGSPLYTDDIGDENWVNYQISDGILHFHQPGMYIRIPGITRLINIADTDRYPRSRVFEFAGTSDEYPDRRLIVFVEERETVYLKIWISGSSESIEHFGTLIQRIYTSLGWSPSAAKEALNSPFP